MTTELKIDEAYLETHEKVEPLTFKLPDQSEWTMRFCEGFNVKPPKGGEPNWFWRRMQYLVFGFKWTKD